ncbi:MAG: RNA polymerase sigma factor [Clostridiales Family XIII bacterium]|nr:RNA polymerase sigma factor [Clostridiales Family XIII bacterium]
MAEQKIIELARRAVGGDRKAFEELCVQKSRSVIFNAYSYVKNLEDAEDIAQETFLTMLGSIKGLKNPEAIDIWILRIVQNKCKRFLVKRSKSDDDVDIDDEAVAGTMVEDKVDFLPEVCAENKELAKRIYDIVMALPLKRRETIIMYYYDDMGYKEIAEFTGVSVNTVATNIMRAKAMIREELEKPKNEDISALSGAKPVSVLGRILKEQAIQTVPDQSVVAVAAKTAAAVMHLASIQPVAAAGVLTGKAALWIAATVVVASGVTGASIVHYKETVTEHPGTTQILPPVAEEVDTGGAIVFSGGTSADGHVNPEGAALEGLGFEVTGASWTITDVAGGLRGEGEGTDPADMLKEMKQNAEPGIYTLTYKLTDPAGNLLEKTRIFEIK